MSGRFTRESPIGVGVVGLGFMGTTHVRAYAQAGAEGLPCRLVAVCDAAKDRLSGLGSEGNLATGGAERVFDPATVTAYSEVDRLLADDRVDLVSICTHTNTHVDLARRALDAGKHVLVEKPVAVTAERVRALAESAQRAAAQGTLCMPAMCMRYWPGWTWLKGAIDSREFGGVRSASFQRLGSGPGWASSFYRDNARSGGALVDLHIHDTDFILHSLGIPREVVSTGTLDHVTTLYRFDDGPAHVMAEGGWNQFEGFPFRMRYIVTFERATADWDLTRTPTLLLCRAGKAEAIELAPGFGYEGEVRAMVSAVASGSRRAPTTVEDALRTAEVLDAERRSLETGVPVPIR